MSEAENRVDYLKKERTLSNVRTLSPSHKYIVKGVREIFHFGQFRRQINQLRAAASWKDF
ncbi:749_t:CDS:2 [Paraglomus brasilianum]|uniref:749_t:CDS:1 n=1 Tax=Paraglomus brasilianum TaxID=144538 RepID=A0A9N9D0H7_9GLOM|nr:749_t:CDS:2 [Paraglomus brasilianum]